MLPLPNVFVQLRSNARIGPMEEDLNHKSGSRAELTSRTKNRGHRLWPIPYLAAACRTIE
jgi:hypothetical protein